MSSSSIPKPRTFNVAIQTLMVDGQLFSFDDKYSITKNLSYTDTIEILRNFILSNPRVFTHFGTPHRDPSHSIRNLYIKYNQNNEKLFSWDTSSFDYKVKKYEKRIIDIREDRDRPSNIIFTRPQSLDDIVEDFKNYMDPIVSVYPALPSPNIRERINTALPGVVHNYLYNNNNSSVPPMPPTAGGYARKTNRRRRSSRRRSNRRRLLRRSRNRR